MWFLSQLTHLQQNHQREHREIGGDYSQMVTSIYDGECTPMKFQQYACLNKTITTIVDDTFFFSRKSHKLYP